MGLNFDWEIESDHERVAKISDDETRRVDWRKRLRYALFTLLIAAAAAGVFVAVQVRLRYVDWEIEQALRDTIDAEITALQLGDRTAFLAIQRSATDEWIQQQGQTFDRYQALKQTQDVNLTGEVLDLAVDGTRARALVQEIIDGVPYGRMQSYWRYEDGWRHVPTDYTFWGDPLTITGERVSVSASGMDSAAASAVAQDVDAWQRVVCDSLGCAAPLTIEIVADPTFVARWKADDLTVLQLTSPYTLDARLDLLFSHAIKAQAALLIADRVIEGVQPFQPNAGSDAAFLRQSVRAWLVSQFSGVDTGTALLTSLAKNYGIAAVGQLISAVPADGTLAVLTAITQVESLHQATLDWRDYLLWQLGGVNAAGEPITILSVTLAADSSGQPALLATTQTQGGTRDDIYFTMVDGIWRRAA
jgi:hypothetical protein